MKPYSLQQIKGSCFWGKYGIICYGIKRNVFVRKRKEQKNTNQRQICTINRITVNLQPLMKSEQYENRIDSSPYSFLQEEGAPFLYKECFSYNRMEKKCFIVIDAVHCVPLLKVCGSWKTVLYTSCIDLFS